MKNAMSFVISASEEPVEIQHSLGTEDVIVLISRTDDYQVVVGPVWLQDGPNAIIFPAGIDFDALIVIIRDDK